MEEGEHRSRSVRTVVTPKRTEETVAQLPSFHWSIKQKARCIPTNADCVGLTNKVPWEKNRQWMQLLAKSGTPLFVSAQPSATGPAQKATIKECFALASQELPLGEPLDWMENAVPRRWRLMGKEERFEWG